MSLFLDNVAKLLYRFRLMIIGVNCFCYPYMSCLPSKSDLPVMSRMKNEDLNVALLISAIVLANRDL